MVNDVGEGGNDGFGDHGLVCNPFDQMLCVGRIKGPHCSSSTCGRDERDRY